MKKIFEFFIFVFTIIGKLLFWLFDFSFILAFPVMWCWNYAIPSITNLPEINYLQAFALYVLCGVLFKPTNIIKNEKE